MLLIKRLSGLDFSDKIYDSDLSCLPDFLSESGKVKSLIYNAEVLKVVTNFVGWGKDESFNEVEQGGLLVGTVSIINQLKDQYQTLVKGFIPAKSAYGSMKDLRFTHKTWMEMLNEFDKYKDNKNSEHLNIVGWLHTHPKHLRVYMSEADLIIQKQLFFKPWHITAILNPHQRCWMNFRGIKAEYTNGFFYTK